MLARKWLLILSFAIIVVSASMSILISHETYQLHIWPYILIFLGFSFARHLFFVIGALLDERRRAQLRLEFEKKPPQMWPIVSIIMPAYNEAKVIENSLRYIYLQEYPNFEVIVVDDGSSDQTFQVAQFAAQQFPSVPTKVLSKVNGGKANALNYGLMHACGELIVCVDADSRLEANSLLNGAKHFLDEKTGAVAGFVEVDNQEEILMRFQQLEYMTSLNFLRKAYSILGVVPIVPGPIGMYRRSALEASGGFTISRKMFAEDAEMSLRLIAQGWKIRSEEGMLSYTEAPNDWRKFFRQRYRWNRGTFQALDKNFSALVAGKNKLSNFIAMHLFVEMWLSPLLNTMLVFNFVIRMFLYQEVHIFTIWMSFGLFIDLWVIIFATYKTGRIFWGIPHMIMSKLFYENTLFFWKLFSLYDECWEKSMSWDKIERSGSTKEINYG